MFDSRVLGVGVGHGVFVGRVRSYPIGYALDGLGYLLGTGELAAPHLVEVGDYLGQRFQFRFGDVTATACRYRVDFGVLVFELDAVGRLLFGAVAVHVRGFQDACGEVVLLGSRELGVGEGWALVGQSRDFGESSQVVSHRAGRTADGFIYLGGVPLGKGSSATGRQVSAPRSAAAVDGDGGDAEAFRNLLCGKAAVG